TVTIPYTQASTSPIPLQVEVDPLRALTETSHTDNTATVPISVTVTALATLETPLGPQVSALFQQQGILQGGVSTSSPLLLDSPTGPQVGTAIAIFPTDSLQSVVTATAMLAPTLLGPGN